MFLKYVSLFILASYCFNNSSQRIPFRSIKHAATARELSDALSFVATEAIVFNSYFNSKWDREERRTLPLISTRLLRINIKVSKNNYMSTIEECQFEECQESGWIKTFEHRLNFKTIEYLTIRGGTIKDLQIFDPTNHQEDEQYGEMNYEEEPNEEDVYENDQHEISYD
ncbi:hypothetical protein B9Z55_017710 [Caenorhabditis nigoni]|uniref:Galectin n=1 Tax=Caenorhabditis nigoni TaxID=1611254 RepID=A0A2G5TAX5_9PELO|nr:hypothetical protein B9Z55_017710 [Caenorhabditis nigoni]